MQSTNLLTQSKNVKKSIFVNRSTKWDRKRWTRKLSCTKGIGSRNGAIILWALPKLHGSMDCSISWYHDFCLDRTWSSTGMEISAKFIESKQRFDTASCDNELFDQVTYLKKYVTSEKITSWEETCIATDQRWVECFKHFSKNNVPFHHLEKIISYILALPGTAAPVERVFSIINEIWSFEKRVWKFRL